MKIKPFKLFMFGFSIFFIVYLYNSLKVLPILLSSENNVQAISTKKTSEYVNFRGTDIVIAVVACGDRLQETLTMLKSALMFTKQTLNFIIFTEDSLMESFKEKLGEWKIALNNSFTFEVLHLAFPSNDENEWKKLFKPCAAQRLFLPDILKEVDSVLYVDTDIIFLTSVESVWAHFNRMNSSQIAALAPEQEDPNVGWYNRFARHPYYGELGVNSGVMLMNLTRMRTFQWGTYVIPIYKKYKLKITWGDQDIINIIFHYHPEKLYVYSCRYNFRPDHCMYMSICKPAEKAGVAVVHGSRGYFKSKKEPVFYAIYQSVEEFNLGSDLYKSFYQQLETYLDEYHNTHCGQIKTAFLKNLEKYIEINRD